MHLYATAKYAAREYSGAYRTRYVYSHAGILESASHQRQARLHRKQLPAGKPPARCLPIFWTVSNVIESQTREIFHIHLPRRVDT